MAHWDERNIPDLHGKVALVTGANSGLGLETSKFLANHGATVIMACRNLEKAERAAAEVGHDAEVIELDLSSLASVADAAKQLCDSSGRLDILINNAGLMAIDQSKTDDGFESQLGVNHLGHFAFTAQLAPLILETPRSRIVNVSSIGHRLGALRADDLMFDRRRYDRWRPYFQSKLANLLFTLELQRRLSEAGSATSALAAHPGASRTDLGREGTGLTNMVLKPGAVLVQPAWLGALPIVRAAVDPAAEGGDFYGPRFLVAGYPVREKPSRRARDAADARRLWERSEEMTGVKFDIEAGPVP